MPAGSNGGGQLNVMLFELGMITRDPLGILPTLTETLAIHPLVVVPTSIQYADTTRSSVVETHGGHIETKAGRASRRVTFSGTFGVESRGLGLYIGTGDLRLKRFWHEVVRLSDAVTKEQVDEENDPFRSPVLSLLLKFYDPERSTFFVNFYDFWHNVQFSCLVESFNFSKNARGGGATGLTPYTLQIRETGPIVTGGMGTALINGLFQALTTWDSINELLKSYTLDAIEGALVDTGGILVSQFTESVNAVNAQIEGATGVINGFAVPGVASTNANAGPSGGSSGSSAAPTQNEVLGDDSDPENGTSGLGSHLEDTARVAAFGADLLENLQAQAQPAINSPGGAIDWGAVDGEGSLPGVDAADNQDNLSAVVDAANFQKAAGALYGMSRDEFAAYLAAIGESGRPPTLSGTVEHTVTQWDTVETLQQQYGVDFDEILRLNELTPDEALLSGTVLLIPQPRQIGQQPRIEGLPVFGSHSGKAAWGADIWVDMRVTADGDLAVATEADCLVQGIDWILDLFGDRLMKLANEVPPVIRDDVIRSRVRGLLLSDRRIASVDRVDLVQDDAQIAITVDCTAINGGEIRTGSAA